MSVKKQIIELRPSSYFFEKEEFEVKGFVCPKCHGSGDFVDIVGRNDIHVNPCGFCDGSGYVKAQVTVLWKSDIDIKSKIVK